MILYRSASVLPFAPPLHPARRGTRRHQPCTATSPVQRVDGDRLDVRRKLHGASRPGAFARSLAHDRNKMRVLFQHGRDPQIGDKPLGIPTLLREDEQGADYEVPLLDTSYNADLIPGLRAGVYGASFRFQVIRENIDKQHQRRRTTRPACRNAPSPRPE